jgi:predicted metalloendopeptidase
MGYQPILPYLKQVRGLKTREELLKLMYELDNKGFNTAPFGISLSLNPFKSSELMINVGHGGTSLAQEYYAEPNETQKKTVEAIKSLNKDYLKMVGHNDADAERMMQAAWAIEHKIGVKTLNQVARRNPMLRIHIMTWEQLLKDLLQLICEQKTVKRLMVVVDDAMVNMLRPILQRYDSEERRTTLLTMQPIAGGAYRHVLLGYSLMAALGISSREIEEKLK